MPYAPDVRINHADEVAVLRATFLPEQTLKLLEVLANPDFRAVNSDFPLK